MMPVVFGGEANPVRRILCIGAHSDDIEIGCGGTILRLIEEFSHLEVKWVVLSGDDRRAAEARCGASLFLANAVNAEVVTRTFRDGFFPHLPEIKEFFEELKTEPTWDLILTHQREDRHQDHRVVSDLTWNTFRDHWILEYEIPKYDGGLGSPNVFVPVDADSYARKLDYLMQAFGSQRDKKWFTRDTFSALMRLRGVESGVPDGYAEGFYARKTVVAF